jgi:hypothetical protein
MEKAGLLEPQFPVMQEDIPRYNACCEVASTTGLETATGNSRLANSGQ